MNVNGNYGFTMRIKISTTKAARVIYPLVISSLSLQAKMATAGEEQRRLAKRVQQEIVESTRGSALSVQQQLGEWYTGGGVSQRTTQDKQCFLRELQLMREQSHSISDACLTSEVLCAL